LIVLRNGQMTGFYQSAKDGRPASFSVSELLLLIMVFGKPDFRYLIMSIDTTFQSRHKPNSRGGPLLAKKQHILHRSAKVGVSPFIRQLSYNNCAICNNRHTDTNNVASRAKIFYLRQLRCRTRRTQVFSFHPFSIHRATPRRWQPIGHGPQTCVAYSNHSHFYNKR
jgi:hypothetical protein